MRKGEVTRQKIIDSAAELIHAHGMNVVSVGDILKASGTGKSQFYSHFESRDELIKSVLKRNEDRICDAMSKPFETWDDVKRWVFIHLEFQKGYGFERGCPFGTAAYALQPGQEEERKPLQKILDQLRERLADFLKMERDAGRYDTNADISRLTSFSVASIQGALILGLIERDESSIRSALEECYAHLASYRVAGK